MDHRPSALTIRPLSTTTQESFQSTDFVRHKDAVHEARSLGECTTPEDDDWIKSPRSSLRRCTTARTKTTLQFCHPPPITKQKRLHGKHRVLLQLHRISKLTRPTPAFDILSTTAFASRLAKDFPSTFKGKHGLGPDDLVIIGSEDYSSNGAQTEEGKDFLDKDSWSSREIVAAIAHHTGNESYRSKTVDICLTRGRTWTGSPMSKGGYEFITVDDHGVRTVARWVMRRGSRRQSCSNGATSSAALLEEKAFNFSLIDPHSRRHAIIATLDAVSLEISDRYTIPMSETLSRPSPAAFGNLSATDDGGIREVDEALRIFITTTGIWVAFCEGFASHDHTGMDPTKAQMLATDHKRRSLSTNLKDSSKHNSSMLPAPTSDTFPPRPAGLQQTVSSPDVHNTQTKIPLMSPPFLTPPRRTQSTGTTVLERLHSRRASVKQAELSPIFDLVEVSPRNSRDLTKIEEPVSPAASEQSPLKIQAPEKEKQKRSTGIKKLCCSFKNPGGGSSSG